MEDHQNYHLVLCTKLEINYLTAANSVGVQKQVEQIKIKNGGGVRYHYIHVYKLLHKWGFKFKVPRKGHINTSSKEEKEAFKKGNQQILDNIPEGFTQASTDESFFFFDALVREVWSKKKSRPVLAIITGPHKHSCLFGAMSLEWKQIFWQ